LTMGEKIGSARKKIDDYLKSHKIETAITPAVSLFGVVEFSLGEVKIDPDPDTWTKIDEKKIEEMVEKTVGISLQEYRELLRSEISSKDINEIKAQIEEIKEYIRAHEEYPFLIPDEFERIQENKFLLKYKSFIGRDDELQELQDFLKGEDKIGFIVGRGGVGKTKLALEFAEQVKALGEWEVYFVNRHVDFHPITLNDKTLLILDEAWGYKDKEKIIDFVLNRSAGEGTKLVMIDRPISKGSIISDLKRKNVHIDPIELGKGDIALFLRENFNEIGEDEIRAVVEKCEGSFVYASFFAEHLREKGEVGDLKEVLAQRIEMYIEDLKDKIGEEQEVIKNAICQISLVTPIDWFNKDREYLEKAFGFKSKYELIDEILNTAYNFPTEFLFYSHHNPSGFLIKPDPVADYLKSEFLKEELCGSWIRQLIPYMPLRLSLNVITIPESNDVSKDHLFKILGEIWHEMNTSGGKTPEYLSALVLFTGNFSSMPFFNLDELNLKKWLECYRIIGEVHPGDPEVRVNLAIALFNASSHYGTAEDFDKMEGCIEELRRLSAGHPDDPEVRKRLAMGLYNATSYYRTAGDLVKIERCLEELRRLGADNPDDPEVRKPLAIGLYNASTYYGTAGDLVKMEVCLEELRRLSAGHPDDPEVRKRLAMGLYNATNDYRTAGDLVKMEVCLEELRRLGADNPDDPEVRKQLAMGLYNASKYYGTAGDLVKIEGCLEELRRLGADNPDDLEVRKQLAMGLVNATSDYRTAGDLVKIEGCLEELRRLGADNPDDPEVRKQLAMGLYNASTYYGTAGDLVKIEGCLEELRRLGADNPDDPEVRKPLAMGLYNATAVKEMIDYEDLFLLHKLRVDLPDDENKQNIIGQIESMLIEAIKNKIEKEYGGGDSDLSEFIEKMKSDLGDAESVLLKASEDFPLSLQKLILESLNK